MFLKRLLFIKAAIDQEPTNDIFQVPITQQEFTVMNRQVIPPIQYQRQGTDNNNQSDAVLSQHPVASEGAVGFSTLGASGLEPRFNDTFSAVPVQRPTSKDGERHSAKRRAI